MNFLFCFPLSHDRHTAHPQGKKQIFQLTGDQDSVRLAEEVWAEAEPEVNPVFTAGRLPCQRQMYYQLCDLRDDRLQAIVHSNDGREEECTVRQSIYGLRVTSN